MAPVEFGKEVAQILCLDIQLLLLGRQNYFRDSFYWPYIVVSSGKGGGGGGGGKLCVTVPLIII